MRKIAALSPVILPVLLLLSMDALHAQDAPNISRRLKFSGMVDADFASDYGSFDQARHVSGLEADLITHVVLNANLYAVVRTTMRDGIVPRQGAGTTWAPLRFDGVQINWRPGDNTILMAGDLVAGVGYFQYYRYKRTAAVVGEHSVRGAGFRYGEFLVQGGIASDSTGLDGDWSMFAQWKRSITSQLAWTTSFRYTGGIPDATPFELGISFDGNIDDVLELHAHVGMNYWNPDTDPGSILLIEPRYTYDRYFFAGTLFLSEKGEVNSPNAARYTGTWIPLDDFVLHFEPGMTWGKTYAGGLPVEYRNASFDEQRDESLWITPTLYVYPAPRAQWWLWAGLAKPLVSGTDGDPQLALGSEIIFTF